jgi:hypothetical protein
MHTLIWCPSVSQCGRNQGNAGGYGEGGSRQGCEVESAKNAAKAKVAAEARAEDARRAKAEKRARRTGRPIQAEEDSSSVYFENCDAVRAADAAPIRVGDPGYASATWTWMAMGRVAATTEPPA